MPLNSDPGAALGLVAKTYFEFLKDSEEVTDKLKEEIKSGQAPYKWFPYAKNKTLTKGLEMIHTIWDAVYAGNQEAAESSKEHKVFVEANEWLVSKW